jgi:hypothetical protein
MMLNGKSYACPFALRIRVLTAAERAALKVSIQLRGILTKIVTYESPIYGDAILDGLNRATLGNELRLKDIPIDPRGPMSDDDAGAECESLNFDRRQLTAEEMATARLQRIKEVTQLRDQGQSERAIAKKVNVSRAQVVRDLADSVGPPGPTDATSTVPTAPIELKKVVGTDGKTYSATKARKEKPEPVTSTRTNEPPPPKESPPPGPVDLLAVLADIRGPGAFVWSTHVCRLIRALGLTWYEVERRLKAHAENDREDHETAKPKPEPLLKPVSLAALKRNREAAAASMTPSPDKAISALNARRGKRAHPNDNGPLFDNSDNRMPD